MHLSEDHHSLIVKNKDFAIILCWLRQISVSWSLARYSKDNNTISKKKKDT
jgi:hypothetical protein